MKKLLVFLCVACLALGTIAFVGCNETGEPSGDGSEKTQTLTGSATLTWHGNLEFLALVDVTLQGDVIQSVTVRDGSFITTDAFAGWEPNKAAYLEQYVGLTVADIEELRALPPEDVNNHYDGGSIEGDVSVVTGASASSTVIAMAVKDAISKYQA